MTSHQQLERLQIARQTALEELVRRLGESRNDLKGPDIALRRWKLKQQIRKLKREWAA